MDCYKIHSRLVVEKSTSCEPGLKKFLELKFNDSTWLTLVLILAHTISCGPQNFHPLARKDIMWHICTLNPQ